MRPEGMSRTLSLGNQYRAPLTVIFSMLTLLSRNCGPGSSEKDRERMPDYLAAINQSAFRLLRSSECDFRLHPPHLWVFARADPAGRPLPLPARALFGGR